MVASRAIYYLVNPTGESLSKALWAENLKKRALINQEIGSCFTTAARVWHSVTLKEVSERSLPFFGYVD